LWLDNDADTWEGGNTQSQGFAGDCSVEAARVTRVTRVAEEHRGSKSEESIAAVLDRWSHWRCGKSNGLRLLGYPRGDVGDARNLVSCAPETLISFARQGNFYQKAENPITPPHIMCTNVGFENLDAARQATARFPAKKALSLSSWAVAQKSLGHSNTKVASVG
jgi:hypothetical protein